MDPFFSPKIVIINKDSWRHHFEHIPRPTTRIGRWLGFRYLDLRLRLRLDIYYWQFRFIYDPRDRKIRDINFLMHGYIDHHLANEKMSATEAWHYHFCRKRYHYESEFILQELHDDNRSERTTDAYYRPHPYALAYKQMWIDSFDEGPSWKSFYHGIGAGELHRALESADDIIHNRVEVINAILAYEERKDRQQFKLPQKKSKPLPGGKKD